jgi:hypothetical protein
VYVNRTTLDFLKINKVVLVRTLFIFYLYVLYVHLFLSSALTNAFLPYSSGVHTLLPRLINILLF